VKGREGVRVCVWILCLRGQALLVKTGVRSLGPGIFLIYFLGADVVPWSSRMEGVLGGYDC
jgi:hypothetical protein